LTKTYTHDSLISSQSKLLLDGGNLGHIHDITAPDK